MSWRARGRPRLPRTRSATPTVRAILFRIDSPGGSAVASETIWREVVLARERGKPVIVSMGNVAGSGGYYVAAPADKIVAEPATLTGSIGVLAGKFVVADLLKKIGVTDRQRAVAAPMRRCSACSRISRRVGAAAARSLPRRDLRGLQGPRRDRPAHDRGKVEAVAKGRVWSGEDAKANGLVDELGGYQVALRLAKEAAKIGADEKFKLAVYPREKSTAERIYDRLVNPDHDSDAAPPAAMQTLAGTLLQFLAGVETATARPRRPADAAARGYTVAPG